MAPKKPSTKTTRAKPSSKKQPKQRPPEPFSLLQPEDAKTLLTALVARHPELQAEINEMASWALSTVSAEAVADEVENAILSLDIDDLDGRAGRKSHGYVEPDEAAAQLLEEAITPYLNNLQRCIDLGAKAAAIETCRGIVFGLYQLCGQDPDGILGYCYDFPLETASRAVAMLQQVSGKTPWQLPVEMGRDIPDWAADFNLPKVHGKKSR